MMGPFPKPGTTSSVWVVAITTSPPGYRSSGAYSGNGPWLSRPFTAGPVPKSYLSQLWAGTYAAPSFTVRGAAIPATVIVLNNSLRFIPETSLTSCRCVPDQGFKTSGDTLRVTDFTGAALLRTSFNGAAWMVCKFCNRLIAP